MVSPKTVIVFEPTDRHEQPRSLASTGSRPPNTSRQAVVRGALRPSSSDPLQQIGEVASRQLNQEGGPTSAPPRPSPSAAPQEIMAIADSDEDVSPIVDRLAAMALNVKPEKKLVDAFSRMSLEVKEEEEKTPAAWVGATHKPRRSVHQDASQILTHRERKTAPSLEFKGPFATPEVYARANKQLIKAMLTEPSRREGLLLFLPAIMKPKEFFEMLSNVLPTSPDEEACFSLLTFCCEWVERNKKTELFNEARQTLSAIGERASTSTMMKFREIGDRLLTALSSSGSDSEETLELFEDGTEDVRKKIHESPTSSTLVETVTDEFESVFLKVYSAISPDHLMKKGKSDSKFGLPVVLATTLVNGISNYVKQSILIQTDADKIVGLIKLFLDIALSSLKRGNFEAARAIYSSFAHSVFSDEKYSLKQLLAKADKDKTMAQLQQLLDPEINAKKRLKAKMQELMEEKKTHTPILGNYTSLLEGVYNQDCVTDEEEYNIDKLQWLCTMTHEYLKAQELCLSSDKIRTPLQTNLISHILSIGVMVLPDDEIERLASKFMLEGKEAKGKKK